MMTIDEMIAVLQGAKEGKKIQCRACFGPCSLCHEFDWHDCSHLGRIYHWDFAGWDYRIAPAVPIEVWIKKAGAGGFTQVIIKGTQPPPGPDWTLFREVAIQSTDHRRPLDSNAAGTFEDWGPYE